MLTLYSLFLSGRGGERRFIPVHCGSHVELLRRAKAALEADEQARLVEARFGEELLFILEKTTETPA
ncbi:MAG: hypothetical protein WCY15_12485 [Phenylobacterium sp.]|jgi:hypothetical protein|uniref:hypothetical protein n=1 Tax=Phenylobacterium sp. TaxID=1871053 RepID=UPI002A3068D9|nr:hypothetical protein [Phenylobacterium sp.]MDD3836870.1 hypothetical protein [Phenylobacterium sp.]MDX9996339.1 hypothetical protein [Phenylobacterium sp.]